MLELYFGFHTKKKARRFFLDVQPHDLSSVLSKARICHCVAISRKHNDLQDLSKVCVRNVS